MTPSTVPNSANRAPCIRINRLTYFDGIPRARYNPLSRDLCSIAKTNNIPVSSSADNTIKKLSPINSSAKSTDSILACKPSFRIGLK